MPAITFAVGAAGAKSLSATQEGAQYAEKLGFDILTFAEHISCNNGPNFEVFTSMNFALAVTKRIKVTPMVTVLPLHHPVRLAHQIMTMDNLSGGRVILAVGPGGEHPQQFAAFGVPVSERGRRTDEMIEIMEGLWTQESFSYHGKFFQFEGLTLEPKPVQKPHPPIWIGGRPGGIQFDKDGKQQFKSKTAAARRAGKYGQGWIPFSVTVDQVRETTEQAREVAREAGRDPSQIVVGINNGFKIRASYKEALAETQAGGFRYGRDISARLSQYELLGTPEDIIHRMEDYIGAGVTHFNCGVSIGTEDGIAQAEIISKKIMPYFR